MSKLWAKDYEVNELIEEFTVGIDYILDQKLIPSDCAASLAHATMLQSIDILTADELQALKDGLNQILKEHAQGTFEIKRSDEDGHTAIENRLVELAGDAGKKIHTGRSRNDQVVTAVRVYGRAKVLDLISECADLIQAILKLAEKHKETPMPGRTHMQIAMPSSVALWAAGFAEELIDSIRLLSSAWEILDQNPLGAAAGYGVPLPLNREMTTELMGFSRIQNNVIYVNNSRGKMELMVLDILDQITLTLSKIAQDLILFSLPEFGYFSLPAQLCTGSSIMPQKKNPDGLELMRAKAGTVSACGTQIRNILRSLPSGYNRDFQETKEPFLKGCDITSISLKMMTLTFNELKVNGDKLRAGFSKEIYATDVALDLVASGKSFRDAYREVGLALDKLEDQNPDESIHSRTYTGTSGNLCLEEAQERLEDLMQTNGDREEFINKALESLMGQPINLLIR
ncbi:MULTISPECIES: argininosuccinate lyase [unclassified Oceanispirochaeta]|uniref:argininosuccinate lyase n=1 Tax=unclassified Oceanispirochaeta TaxID=2635722 RepID=UPI000E090191|nr:MULTISPECIES: argininosuccinate lyase [unclassified Oceanispirochaeta]MBF9017106.1 argininosuccinate lyase [Oceanispirochaeta sp. M2]NPD73555.1 argininosuccinate lyase [Oceanispirochaeta sp. M1]RDG30660.1 argininosuccinate lyase [Oceanispirochaeta sp. M1]